jgi:hypothetical protein
MTFRGVFAAALIASLRVKHGPIRRREIRTSSISVHRSAWKLS